MEDEDYNAVNNLGYCPCKENILLGHEYLESSKGICMGTPARKYAWFIPQRWYLSAV